MENHEPNIKIGIVGIGAIGTVVSFGLKDIYQLDYFNRSPRNKISIKLQGKTTMRTIQLSTIIESKTKYDWLLICVKEYHNQVLIPLIKKIIYPQTKIAVIRNGLNIKGPFSQMISEDQIIECVIDCPSEEIKKGHYLQFKKGIIHVKKSRLTNEFSNLFVKNRIVVEERTDFHTFKWKKLIASSALGAIQTILADTCRLFKDEKYLDLYKSVLLEGIQVGRADGAEISDDFLNDQVQKLLNYPENKGSSMLADFLNGREIEWKAKNGVISKIGKQYQINTEINDDLCHRLEQMNKNNSI